ncbi:phosphoribosylamine--glycine ligase [Candidatus Micrarchaeota archaeon]|nr:phosphoribosylamine--glycine ligase [Candidatus Micrarchaeota archaeon]
MRVLLLGHGSREHCMAEALKRNPETWLYSVMAHLNPGIKKLSEEFRLMKLSNFDELHLFAEQVKPDFAVIGPEAPLADGVVDYFGPMGIPSFGPTQELAKLETSKAFSRLLMKKYGIPGLPEFKVFTSLEGVQEYLEALGDFVIKPDGLTGGKGVKVFGEHLKDASDGLNYCREVLKTHPTVIVEEKLEGEEFSLQSIADGKTVLDTPPAQDHKRAFENDSGANTGGMGSYSCENHLLPFVTEEDVKQAHGITEKVMHALSRECGKPFVGVMYGGFMVTAKGLRLLEYNARFGDPETMNVLPIMENDFTEVVQAAIEQRLDEINLRFLEKATVCKYVVPAGYPNNPSVGERIEVDERGLARSGAHVYFGSVNEKDGGVYTTSSRAIAVLGIGEDLSDAERRAQAGVERISGKVFYRKDIGTSALVQKRIDHINSLKK